MKCPFIILHTHSIKTPQFITTETPQIQNTDKCMVNLAYSAVVIFSPFLGPYTCSSSSCMCEPLPNLIPSQPPQ